MRLAGALGIAVTTAAVMAGCGSTSISAPREFVIHVDSITGPTAISGGVAFESRLWGTVGPNGCSAFKELRTARVPEQIDVTVVGQQSDGICTQAIVRLDGVVLRVEPVIPFTFRIVVHQEDGSVLVRRIYSE